MPFNAELPEWKKDNPDVRPAQSKLDAGWVPLEKPPASMWNWFANRTYAALKQLFDFAVHKESKALIDYVVSTGPKNVYVVTLNYPHASYTEGLGFSVKINAASDAASTINVNNLGPKAIKKADGSNVTNLKVGGVYTLRYNGTAFILQGEGGEYGTATEADVLAPKTIGTENGIKTGTIIEKNASNGDIAAAYHSPEELAAVPGTLYVRPNGIGGTKPTAYKGDTWLAAQDPDFTPANFLADKNVFGLQGAMPNLANLNAGVGVPANGEIKPLAFEYDVLPPSNGYYSTYSRIRQILTNLIPSNVRGGTVIPELGLTGTLTPTSMGGAARLASGSVQSSNTSLQFRQLDDWSQLTNAYYVTVGLDFEPDLIFIYWSTNVAASVTSSSIYQNNHPRWARAVSLQNSSHYTTGGTGVSRVFRGDTDNSYVNSNGFLLPVGAGNTSYKWFAIKY